MAGSTPDTPDDDAPAPAPGPEPVERRLASRAEIVEAIDALVDRAQSRLRVFDTDLAQGGWGGPGRAERLQAFLRRSPHARVEIIVHDTRTIERACPRLLLLLKAWSHAMTVYRTGPDARHAMDPLVIADDRHHLHHHHADHPRATLAFDAPLATQPLAARFDEIWATGEPGLSATTLGL